jgi:hypothetical protein
MRFSLRTLLIAGAVVPPLVAGIRFLVQTTLGMIVVVFVVYFFASFDLGPKPDERRYD